MIRHVLIPTDGSESARGAARRALEFAAALGARATGLHVIVPFHAYTYRSQVMLSYHRALPEDSQAAYEATTTACARRILDEFEGLAEEAGVRCDTLVLQHDEPFRAILDAAQRKRCDLIAMASAGRSGISGVLLGNEAHKVLTHGQLPVLVFR